MEAPKLTSFEIVEIQQEVCHLMALAEEEQDPEELASLSDADLERVEGASRTLVAVRKNLKLKKSDT